MSADEVLIEQPSRGLRSLRALVAVSANGAGLASSCIFVTRTGPRLDVGFEVSGIFFVLLLGPAIAASAYALAKGFDRPLAALVLAGSVFAVALAWLVLGMRAFGEGIGTLLTLGAAKTVILPLPLEITAACASAAATRA
jgi:hypothetical protein